MKFIYKASKERQFKERYLHVERMKLSFSKFYSCRENIFHLMLRQKRIAKLQSNLLCRGAWTTLTLISPMCIFPVMFLSQPLIYMGLYSKTSLLRWKWKETSLCLYRWEMLMRWDSSPSLFIFFIFYHIPWLESLEMVVQLLPLSWPMRQAVARTHGGPSIQVIPVKSKQKLENAHF